MHIFISYARKDGAEVAQWLVDALKQRGHETWMDRNLHAHKDFDAEIEKAIGDASHVVVCGTADVQREDSFVRREIRFAQSLNKPIIPLMLPGGFLPITIINHTYVDFADREAGMTDLLRQLALASASSAAVATPAADAASAASSRTLAGTYRITGSNPGDQGIYQGTMTITGADPHYEITWDTGVMLYGYGLRQRDVLAAVYLSSYSLAVYQIDLHGRLSGSFVDKNANARGYEDATPRGTMNGLSGEYDVQTRIDDGRELSATLKVQHLGRRAGGLGGLFGNVVQVAGVYLLTYSWENIAQTMQGVGFVVGDEPQEKALVVGYPGEPHGLIGYQIRPDGMLAGTWFGAGQSMLGTEDARRT